jgi:hypothetical protein
MIKPEDPVTLAPKSGLHIAKKTAVALLALFVASCVGIGLIVYFATIAGYQCDPIHEVTRKESAQDANLARSDKVHFKIYNFLGKVYLIVKFSLKLLIRRFAKCLNIKYSLRFVMPKPK